MTKASSSLDTDTVDTSAETGSNQFREEASRMDRWDFKLNIPAIQMPCTVNYSWPGQLKTDQLITGETRGIGEHFWENKKLLSQWEFDLYFKKAVGKTWLDLMANSREQAGWKYCGVKKQVWGKKQNKTALQVRLNEHTIHKMSSEMFVFLYNKRCTAEVYFNCDWW